MSHRVSGAVIKSGTAYDVDYRSEREGNRVRGKIAGQTSHQYADYNPYSITAPIDSRLPGGGGYTISGLYDVVPNLFGRVDSLTTPANKYGNWVQNYNGVDLTLNVRTKGGMTLQGGASIGQNFADACDVRNNLPELNANIGAGLVGSTTSPTSPY